MVVGLSISQFFSPRARTFPQARITAKARSTRAYRPASQALQRIVEINSTGFAPDGAGSAKSSGMKMSLQEPFANTKSKPLCVWLVDDHQDLRAILADMLRRDDSLRCERQFSSAEAVLAALGQGTKPDVILTDVNMGGMTGVDAIQPIKRLARSTRVFIMTTFYDSVNVELARANGAAGFFLKCGDWEDAMARIRDATLDWAEPAPAPVALVAPERCAPPLFERALTKVRALLAGTSRQLPSPQPGRAGAQVWFEGPV